MGELKIKEGVRVSVVDAVGAAVEAAGGVSDTDTRSGRGRLRRRTLSGRVIGGLCYRDCGARVARVRLALLGLRRSSRELLRRWGIELFLAAVGRRWGVLPWRGGVVLCFLRGGYIKLSGTTWVCRARI
jgi:hypothetical protein